MIETLLKWSVVTYNVDNQLLININRVMDEQKGN
jgi:hypothetical protein